MLVRDATKADVTAIADLFNALIATTTVAWRDDATTREEQLSWMQERQSRGDPTLVADDGGNVVGYCCWTSFRGGDRFPGYRHTMVAGIDADNHSSVDFHAALGFTEVGRMPETGRKFGRWLELVLMQRIL